MAAKSQQKDDLLQIVLFTFCLCTVVFTGWGVFSNLRVKSLLKGREAEASNLKSLEKELRDPKNVQAFRDYQARLKSETNAGKHIDRAVAEVLKSSRLQISKNPPTPPKPLGQGMFEYSYRVTFKPAQIDDAFSFLARLEAEAPHLEFRGVTVKSTKRKDDDPEEWELDVTLVTYAKE